MKQLILILIATFCTILAHTFGGVGTFLAMAILYSYCLFRLFFLTSPQLNLTFLITITIGQELLLPTRLGIASLLSFSLMLLYLLFGQQLRFTSLFTRYCGALFLLLVLYALLLYPLTGILYRLESLLFLFIPVCILVYLIEGLRPSTSYELL